VPVVVERLVSEVEPDELLGRETRDGDSVDRPRTKPVRRILVDAALIADLAPEPTRVEGDRVEVH
jgi:hypothetical protein